MTTLQGVRIVILLAPCILSASVNVEKLVHDFHIDKIFESLQQRGFLKGFVGGRPAPKWTWTPSVRPPMSPPVTPEPVRYLLQEDHRREAFTIPQCKQQGIQDCWPVTFNIADLGEGQEIMLIEGADIELKVGNN